MADDIDEKAMLEKFLEQSGLFRPPGWLDPNATYDSVETIEEAEERLRQFRESMAPTPEEIAKVAEAEAAAAFDAFCAAHVGPVETDADMARLEAAIVAYWLARSPFSAESAATLLPPDEQHFYRLAKRAMN